MYVVDVRGRASLVNHFFPNHVDRSAFRDVAEAVRFAVVNTKQLKFNKALIHFRKNYITVRQPG